MGKPTQSYTISSKTKGNSTSSALLDRAKTVLEEVYAGNESKMARELGWAQSTLNRTLNQDATEKTVLKNLRLLMNDLVEQGVVRKEFASTGTAPIRPPDSTVIEESTNEEGYRIEMVSVRASAGDGAYATEREKVGTYIIDPSELPRGKQLRNGMFVIEVDGDSMKPEFRSGDRVIINPMEYRDTIRTDGVYLFRLEDAIMLKRLQRLPDRRIRVLSNNDQYKPYVINIDGGTDFEVLGKVWGRFERY